MVLWGAERQRGARAASRRVNSMNTQTNVDRCYSQEGAEGVADFKRVLIAWKSDLSEIEQFQVVLADISGALAENERRKASKVTRYGL